MNCKIEKDQLWDYYDGECPADRRGEISRHLPECSVCQTQLDQWSALSRATFPRKQTSAPAFLWTRVLAGIEQIEQAGIWWRQWGWMRGVTAAVALFVFVVSGLVYYQANQGAPLELLFAGQSGPTQTLRLSSKPNASEVTAWVLNGDSPEAQDDTEAKI
jgi:anti-sigma factor RsiW